MTVGGDAPPVYRKVDETLKEFGEAVVSFFSSEKTQERGE